MTDYSELKNELVELSDFLIALGDKNRQAIINRLLEEKDCSGLQVTDLIETTKLSRPAISYHLKILKVANLISFRQEGKKNFYYLAHDQTQIKKLHHYLAKVMQVIDERR